MVVVWVNVIVVMELDDVFFCFDDILDVFVWQDIDLLLVDEFDVWIIVLQGEIVCCQCRKECVVNYCVSVDELFR